MFGLYLEAVAKMFPILPFGERTFCVALSDGPVANFLDDFFDRVATGDIYLRGDIYFSGSALVLKVGFKNERTF